MQIKKHNFCADCTKDSLPNVIGNGQISPMKNLYKHDEEINLVCSDGHKSQHNTSTICKNGQFQNVTFECVESGKTGD